MSPPCVAFFEGDNGGATHFGVTRNEITAVFVEDAANYNVGDDIENSPPAGTYCDLDLPPNTGGIGCYVRDTARDHKYVRIHRAFSNALNERYQTYGRRLHMWVYWGLFGASAEQRRAEAVSIYTDRKPFAVIDFSLFTGHDAHFIDMFARRNVMLFSGLQYGGLPASFFQKYSPHLWGFTPDLERLAPGFSSYLCARVAPYRVSHALGGVDKNGQPMNGQPRRYALMYSRNAAFPQAKQLAELVKEQVRDKCGMTFAVDIPFDEAAADEYPVITVRLKDADVTTVIQTGIDLVDFNVFFSAASDSAKYYPEIITLGDGETDRNFSGRAYNQNWARNLRMISHQVGYTSLEESGGFQACREGDPNLSRLVCQIATATRYRDYFILFKSVQAAGPRLSPSRVDRGLHALPRIASTSHSSAACFFEVGDYTCVKDLMEEWWDGSRTADGQSSPGCYRMVNGGKRYLPTDWPPGVDVFVDRNAPCNAFTLGGPFDP